MLIELVALRKHSADEDSLSIVLGQAKRDGTEYLEHKQNVKPRGISYTKHEGGKKRNQ